MGLSYKGLWILLAQKEINKTQLREMTGIGTATLAKLSKNEYVSLEVIDKICNVLECKIGEVMEHIPEQKDGETDWHMD